MTRVLGYLVLILTVVAGFLVHELHAAQKSAHAYAFTADSAQAAADTTRRVAGKALALLGDSLTAVTRRSVQMSQGVDALDRELKQRRVAETALTAQIDSLHSVTLGATTMLPDSSRHAEFQVDTTPYHVHADVRVPAPPAASTLSLKISLDPAHVGIRIGCSALPNSAGVYSAQSTVVAPDWLALSIDTVTQDRGVCAKSAPAPVTHWYTRPRVLVPVTAIATLLVWEHWARPWLERAAPR